MQHSFIVIVIVVLAIANLPQTLAQNGLSCTGPCELGCPTGYACVSDQCCAPPAVSVTSSTAPSVINIITIASTASTVSSTTSTTLSSTTCVDAISNCAQYTAQCNNALYRNVMYQQCRRTCNLCNSNSLPVASTQSSTSCSDRSTPDGRSDCAELSYLCNNSLYYTLMTQQCPKTCGRC